MGLVTTWPLPAAIVFAILLAVAAACPAPEARAEGAAVAPASSMSLGTEAELGLSWYLAYRAKQVREHIADLIAAAPDVPAQLAHVEENLAGEIERFGHGRTLFRLILVTLFGLALERGLRRAATGSFRWRRDYRVTTTAERLRVVAMRAVVAVSGWMVFTVGAVGAFLAAEWPSVLSDVALGYLLAIAEFKAAVTLSRLVLVPDIEEPLGAELRIIPVQAEAARRAHRHIALFAGWLTLGRATVGAIGTLGAPLETRELVAYLLGIGLVAIALHALWGRRPGVLQPPTLVQQFSRRAGAWLWSLYVVLLWALWVAGATPTMWLCIVLGGLWAAIHLTNRAVAHLAREPGAASAEPDKAPSIALICVERAIRAILIIGAAALLVHVLNVRLATMTAGETAFSHFLETSLHVLVIVLVADLIWNILKAAIERKLGVLGPAAGSTASGTEDRHQARLRTLLPVSKKIAAVLILFTAALSIASEFGVQIGPIIAGAGVIGLAVSFGAQTLIRDIFSGFFYLLDDAFRVGEYIQAGNYKGTVEAFSIRSVRLRHHRGPLYTVPFGALGAIQNMSRDWVIDILSVGVTYDTDLDAVKKIVKKVGRQLTEDPELAPVILDTLKMQGVQQFGDFAIQIRLKLMTRPGEQFTVRRRAYAIIKKEFDVAGIKFAFPTVQVAGDGASPSAAAARQAIQLVQSSSP